MAISARSASPSADYTLIEPSAKAAASVGVSAAETKAAAARAESFQRCMFAVTFKIMLHRVACGEFLFGMARPVSPTGKALAKTIAVLLGGDKRA